jgi:hypothetical protein
MTGFQSKRDAAADKQHWNEDEWRRNNWRCGHGWLRGEQCEICNAPKQHMAADKLWDKPSVAFDEWWNDEKDENTNPFRLESGAYWAWAGWKAALAQPAQEPVAFESFLESQDFYELMQTYRHCLTDALLPFEEVKDALRAAHIGSKP